MEESHKTAQPSPESHKKKKTETRDTTKNKDTTLRIVSLLKQPKWRHCNSDLQLN